MGFNSRDIAVMALSTAFWSALNVTLAPIFWQMTHLPFLCDLLAMISLILGLWWVRKPGTGTIIGLATTFINLVARPGAFFFLGFTAASIVFDLAVYLVGYDNSFSKKTSPLILVTLGVFSTWIASLIIGSFFMDGRVPLLWFSFLHASGGFIGSIIGIILVKSLEVRGIKP
ncbi:MAG: hypothetical protein J7L38_06540 [Thermoproteales archaeon]|nr:hypothetical protein [Thermoproteales archaeon]RLE67117.1 MAG: hypothetical protein DRJ47_00975 [Thermoprotei archaeon]